MRLKHGGYTPKIGGRPVSEVTTAPMPQRLIIDLVRRGVAYEPVVRDGQQVTFGEPLATVDSAGGTLALPAPASGQVVFERDNGNDRLVIEGPSGEAAAEGFEAQQYERSSAETIKELLARGGVWPFFWSERERGIPNLAGESQPRAVVVNFILTEPFRARGKVIITRSWNRIVTGIRFLQRLISDYGSVEVVLTDTNHPVARMMYSDLKGFAWVRIHSVPLTYPIENPRILSSTVRAALRDVGSDEDIWVVDAQGVEAVGACLGEGLPLHERVVAVGGPAQPNPRHFAVRIGTPLEEFIESDGRERTILAGGLLTGVPVAPSETGVGYDDDAYFSFPTTARREFLGFIRPGFTRTSYTKTFASSLFGTVDRHINATLRGEPRACISCGLCESVCPAGIMPQVVHRYLYRDQIESAEKAGLDRCVDCNLCTYVCPSKIELQRQFSEARAFILKEKEEMAAVAARSGGGEAEEEETA